MLSLISLILTALRSLAAMVWMALVDQPAVPMVHPTVALPDLLACHMKHAAASLRSNTAYFL